jgi:membrane protease YdiL (CAAX protease family)
MTMSAVVDLDARTLPSTPARRAERILSLALAAPVSLVFVVATQAASFTVLHSITDTDRFWQWPATGAPAFALSLLLLLLTRQRAGRPRILSRLDHRTAVRLATIGTAWLTWVILTEGGTRHGPMWHPEATTLLGTLSFLGFGLVAEELIFRGVVFQLAADAVSTRAAIVITAALFGLSHLAYHDFELTSAAIQQASYTSVIGLLLGWQRQRTGALTLPIATHFLLNLPFAIVGHL